MKENLYFREILDLWDVVKEFAEEEQYRDLEIIKAGRTLYKNRILIGTGTAIFLEKLVTTLDAPVVILPKTNGQQENRKR